MVEGIYLPPKHFTAWKSSKNHEKQHFLLHFWYLQTPFGVSIKLQKLPSSIVFLPKNIFMHVTGPKTFSTYSLDQGEQNTYPQDDMICHRSVSNAI